MTPSDNTPESTARFPQLIAAHSRIINKVCYMYARCVEDYDDMRQEVYINLWQGLERFRGEADMSTWVYRVALNSCVSYFRKNRRNIHTSLSSLYDMQDDTDPSRDVIYSELHTLIDRLDALEKAMILLWLDEYSYEKIAEVMDMPRNTVASRLHRIKEKLARLAEQ